MTTIAGVIGLLAIVLGIVIGSLVSNSVHVPSWMYVVESICVGLPIAINGYFGGKNPDGTTKTPIQVNELNSQAANTQPPKTV